MGLNFTTETCVILFVTVTIIIGNILILLVLLCTNCIRNLNKLFFCSLTFSDLFLGLFITPFSIFSSLYDHWFYRDKFCHVEAYLATIFWIAGLYFLMCINVDHYVAIRRPERYHTTMSPVRCLCWTAFVWVAAISFCCPPLFALQHAKYYKEAYLCIIDANLQMAYFITAGLIISCPPIFGLIYTNAYLCSSSFRERRQVYEKVLKDRASRPWNYFINFVISVIFTFSWIPWCILKIHDIFYDGPDSNSNSLHFYLLWLAIGNSFYKFFVYLVMSREFRTGMQKLCGKCNCSCIKSSAANPGINFITLTSK